MNYDKILDDIDLKYTCASRRRDRLSQIRDSLVEARTQMLALIDLNPYELDGMIKTVEEKLSNANITCKDLNRQASKLYRKAAGYDV